MFLRSITGSHLCFSVGYEQEVCLAYHGGLDAEPVLGLSQGLVCVCHVKEQVDEHPLTQRSFCPAASGDRI